VTPPFSWDLVASFLVLAEELKFRTASERLGVSRQTLSKRIDRLEGQLDTVLVVRSTRRVELTAAGATLRDHAVPIAQAMAQAAQQVRLEHPGRPLAIGVSTDLGPSWDRLVERWVNDRGAHAIVERRAPDESVRQLRGGSLDLVLFASELPDRPSVTVGHEPTVVLFPAGHPAAVQSSIEVGDLRGLPVAVTDAGEPEHHRAAVLLLHGDPDLPYLLSPRVGTISQGLLHTARTRGAAAVVMRRGIADADTTGLAVLPMSPPHLVPVTLLARPGLPDEPFRSLTDHLLSFAADDPDAD
jgi:DNA-binding transcriptional LysR family regulator